MDPVNDKLTALVTKIYDANVIAEWKKTGKTVRELFELPSKTATQCNNTIGKPSGTCWLCGLEFDEKVDALTPICEHVLPIAQAVTFLELYSTQHSVEEDIAFLQLEYGWAHKLCNSVKSDFVFIKQSAELVDGYNLYEVNTGNIDKFIIKLKASKSVLKGRDTIKMHINSVGWNHKPNIINKVQKVVDFINKPIKQGFGALLVLSQASAIHNPTSRRPEFVSPIKPPRPIASADENTAPPVAGIKRPRGSGKTRGRKRTHRHKHTRRHKAK
jgi:hypothetical protein